MPSLNSINPVIIQDFSLECKRNSKRMAVEFWICAKIEGSEGECIHFKVLDISRTGIGLRMEAYHVNGEETPSVLERLVEKGSQLQFAGSKMSKLHDLCQQCYNANELEYYHFLDTKGEVMWALADRCGVRFTEPLTDSDHELIDDLGS